MKQVLILSDNYECFEEVLGQYNSGFKFISDPTCHADPEISFIVIDGKNKLDARLLKYSDKPVILCIAKIDTKLPTHLNQIAMPIELKSLFRLVDFCCNLGQVRINIGEYELDKIKRTIKINEQEITLTEMEVNLISYLFDKKKPVDKDTLLKEIWRGEYADTHTLETHIYRIRQKLESFGELIVTTKNGYQLKY